MKRSHLLVTQAGLLVSVTLFASCNTSTFRPPEREGPLALVQQEKTPRLWLMLKQEEQRSRHIGGGSRSIGKWVNETYYHFDLQAHDPATTARLWKKRMLTVKDDAGGHTAHGRLLGQEGDVVWLFLNDGPVAVSSRDASKLADRSTIEARNPALRDLIPKDLDYYAYDGSLIIIAADARRFKIRASDFAAEPYTPPNDEYFRNIQFMATRWNGGYSGRDFLVRQMMLKGQWIGFFNEKEASDAGDDGFGDKIATGEPGSNPDRVYYETTQARRTFWTARIGKTREFSEGTHDRLFDVKRVPGAPEFLEGGLLKRAGVPVVFRVKDPDGFLVVHRTRLDEEGRVALTRLDENLHQQWMAKLPLHEMRNRAEIPGGLLFYGRLQETSKGVTSSGEHLVALNLSDGKVQSWDVTREQPD